MSTCASPPDPSSYRAERPAAARRPAQTGAMMPPHIAMDSPLRKAPTLASGPSPRRRSDRAAGGVSVFLFEDSSSQGPNQIALILAAGVAILVGVRLGYPWRELERGHRSWHLPLDGGHAHPPRGGGAHRHLDPGRRRPDHDLLRPPDPQPRGLLRGRLRDLRLRVRSPPARPGPPRRPSASRSSGWPRPRTSTWASPPAPSSPAPTSATRCRLSATRPTLPRPWRARSCSSTFGT